MPSSYDLVILGGRIIDPASGRDEITDVGIAAGAITRVGSIAVAQDCRTIDARGKVVCPGFVDIHAHGQSIASDWMQVHDGVTTALELEVGVFPVAGWYDHQASAGRVLNYGASVGWIFGRKAVMANIAPDPEMHPMAAMGAGSADEGGWSSGTATADQVMNICHMVEEGLRQGAIGIGLPHGYAPGAGTKEMTRICALAAKLGVPTFTHISFMSNTDPHSSEEAYVNLIGYAAATGAHMHVCHLNSTSLLDIERCCELLQHAQSLGLPITVEAYPYGLGSTVISAAFFAEPDFVTRTGSGYDSIELLHSRKRMESREDLLAARENDPAAIVIWDFLDLEHHQKRELLLDRSVLYPGGAIASDAMPWVEPDGSIYRGAEWPLPSRLSSHPRSAATFTKFVAEYHRQRDKIGLMEAIAKCTINPTRVIEECVPAMRRKARLQEDCDADIIVFDPEAISGRSSFLDMTAPSVGMEAVLVGGVPVIWECRLDTAARPGLALRTDGAADGA